jgi:hypothetical protein
VDFSLRLIGYPKLLSSCIGSFQEQNMKEKVIGKNVIFCWIKYSLFHQRKWIAKFTFAILLWIYIYPPYAIICHTPDTIIVAGE